MNIDILKHIANLNKNGYKVEDINESMNKEKESHILGKMSTHMNIE